MRNVVSKNVVDRIADQTGDWIAHRFGATTGFDPDYIPPIHTPFGDRDIYKATDTQSVIGEILAFASDNKSSVSQTSLSPWFREAGHDYLAYYKPYFNFGDDWGIYFDVDRMSNFIQDYGFGEDEALILHVLHHERFHFLVEHLCAVLVPPTHRGLYDNQPYDDYQRANKNGPFFPVEEALANAYALTRSYRRAPTSMSTANLVKELAKLCDQAPSGYRDYRLVCDPMSLYQGKRAKRDSWLKFFNNSFAVFFGALQQRQSISFNIFSQFVVSGTSPHVKQLLLTENQLAQVPVYLLYPVTSGASLLNYITPKKKLKEFYQFIESQYGVIYREGRSHGKLVQPSSGKKLNAWQRKNGKADLKHYQLKQAANWLGVPTEVLAEEFKNH